MTEASVEIAKPAMSTAEASTILKLVEKILLHEECKAWPMIVEAFQVAYEALLDMEN
jgi:hypothetical protein